MANLKKALNNGAKTFKGRIDFEKVEVQDSVQ
jgi:hypothetical protein